MTGDDEDREQVIPSMIGMFHDVDVSTTPPTDGQALTWDETVGKFVPSDLT